MNLRPDHPRWTTSYLLDRRETKLAATGMVHDAPDADGEEESSDCCGLPSIVAGGRQSASNLDLGRHRSDDGRRVVGRNRGRATDRARRERHGVDRDARVFAVGTSDGGAAGLLHVLEGERVIEANLTTHTVDVPDEDALDAVAVQRAGAPEGAVALNVGGDGRRRCRNWRRVARASSTEGCLAVVGLGAPIGVGPVELEHDLAGTDLTEAGVEVEVDGRTAGHCHDTTALKHLAVVGRRHDHVVPAALGLRLRVGERCTDPHLAVFGTARLSGLLRLPRECDRRVCGLEGRRGGGCDDQHCCSGRQDGANLLVHECSPVSFSWN